MTMIPKNVLVDAYQETLGMEKAASLLDESTAELGMQPAASYSVADTKRIIEHLKQKGGLVKIIASTIATRLILSGKFDQ